MRHRMVRLSALVARPWVRPLLSDGEVVEQLELGLFPNEPWEGRSPRVLTRGHLGVIFKPQGVRARVVFSDRSQLELFPVVGRSARMMRRAAAPSAPTLLPLPEFNDG